MLDQCNELCGWISGVIAALAFGSFGVPIKLTCNVKVDPLVMQTYKSSVAFLCCWVVLLVGEPLKFSPWGILSGLFWCPGGCAAIYAIRTAGLTVSVGTWAPLYVINSFCWGILIFGESVKSIHGTAGAAFVLILGLIGMTIYSSPVKSSDAIENDDLKTALLQDNDSYDKKDKQDKLLDDQVKIVELTKTSTTNGSKREKANVDTAKNTSPRKITRRKRVEDKKETQDVKNTMATTPQAVDTIQSVATTIDNIIVDEECVTDTVDVEMDKSKEKEDLITIFGVKMTRRTVGLLAAIFNGVWGGNNMVPLHWARQQGFSGAGYLISYACGSMIVTIMMWVVRYMYNVYVWDFDAKQAYNALPSFHLREMYLPGFMAGLLVTLGKFCSIMAVTALGQGVGYSFVQTNMLVSGVWGIFFFGEVQGADRIFKWLLSSGVTIIGILWLSYEHQSEH